VKLVWIEVEEKRGKGITPAVLSGEWGKGGKGLGTIGEEIPITMMDVKGGGGSLATDREGGRKNQ